MDRNSPRALLFENPAEGVFALTLAGAYKELGIVNLYEGSKQFAKWSYTEIGIGKAENAVRARFEEILPPRRRWLCLRCFILEIFGRKSC